MTVGLKVGQAIERDNARHYTARVMTADVAQAVEALRAALLAADEIDQARPSAKLQRRDQKFEKWHHEVVAAHAKQREASRDVIRKRRAELDAILLGPEA